MKPVIYGEEKFFLMMGGLHIEVAACLALGKRLEYFG